MPWEENFLHPENVKYAQRWKGNQKSPGKYLRALLLLASLRISRGDHERAILLFEKYLTIDPYHDEIYCQTIEQYLALGEKAAALRTFRRYANEIASELGVSLPPRMEELRKHIQAG